jgi:hypothetical protein
MNYLRTPIAACFFLAIGHVQGAAPDITIASDRCHVQTPRLPKRYFSYPALHKVPINERNYSTKLFSKARKPSEPGFGLEVWAQFEEMDIDGDSICDLLVTTHNYLSSGGDSDALSTVYLATSNGWSRIGAKTAEKTDLSTELDSLKVSSDENYEFSDHIVIRLKETGKSYIIAWHYGRVANGFSGYRILEVDRINDVMKNIDKWNGVGAQIYQWFRSSKNHTGTNLFDADLEADELRQKCRDVTVSDEGLFAACRETR